MAVMAASFCHGLWAWVKTAVADDADEAAALGAHSGQGAGTQQPGGAWSAAGS